jgi:hypothetical protein
MTRYTVVWLTSAQNDLAQLWIDAEDRKAVEEAGNAIDRELANDPGGKGTPVSEGLRALDIEPLRVTFTFEDADRLAKVLSVHLIAPFPPSLSNGEPPPAPPSS